MTLLKLSRDVRAFAEDPQRRPILFAVVQCPHYREHGDAFIALTPMAPFRLPAAQGRPEHPVWHFDIAKAPGSDGPGLVRTRPAIELQLFGKHRGSAECRLEGDLPFVYFEDAVN